jgi:hypothetical protein
MFSVGVTDGLLILATVFLAVHLLTDARRMVQVLRLGHNRYHNTGVGIRLTEPHPTRVSITTPDPCPRCRGVEMGIKEAWWEVVTFVALVGHLVMDYVS